MKYVIPFALALASPIAQAVPFQETTDAGTTLGSVIDLNPGIDSISGSISIGSDPGDAYRFLWGGGTFFADTSAGTEFDSMISIFDNTGSLLFFNDETSQIPNSLFSRIEENLSAGVYILGITAYPNAFMQNLQDYEFGDLGSDGVYQISMSELSAPAAIPEPGVLALLGVGALSFLVRRRRT